MMNIIYKIANMFSLLLLFPVLSARGAVDTDLASPIPFIVHTNGVSFTVQEVDAVLATARDFLRQDGLHISFDFDENIIVQDKVDGCGGITDLLRKGISNVYIVNDIPCCGSADEIRDNIKIDGCSGPTTAIIVVMRGNNSMNHEILLSEAVLWMHELGHNKGLCHNDFPGELMARSHTTGNTELNDCEKAILTNNITALCKPACGIQS
jgi:hypothetical protein